jgi:filamentous hemagglutinin family protein
MRGITMQLSSMRNRILLCGSSLAVLAGLPPAVAGGVPTGGVYTAGQGTIAAHGSALTVTQSSVTGVIDWNSFNIGRNAGVSFDNGKGATLNVVSGGAAHIAGQLSATGSLFVMDRQGVVIDHTGHVVTGGAFVATSRGGDLGSDGRLALSGRASGKIVNNGSISAANVGLDGRGTTNTGEITVLRDGHIWLKGPGTTTNTGALVTGDGGHIETSGRSVALGGNIDAGKGGKWVVDPYDLTIDATAATTIDNSLNAGTSVSLATSATGTSGPGTPNPSGSGDILIDSALTWNTTATLTMSAYRNIDFNAAVTASGGGSVVLNGGYSFGLGPRGFAGSLSFTGGASSGSALTINGNAFTLLYAMSDLENVNASATSLAKRYALAQSLDASAVTGWVPIGTNGSGTVLNGGSGFSGTLEGLGNTISNLSVNLGSNAYAALFGYSNGVLQDIGIVGGSFTGGNFVGSLAGSAGNIYNAFSTASVTGSGVDVGGLAGSAFGIGNSHATGTVSGNSNVGGLAGYVAEGVSQSYATGNVSGASVVGGLVGYAGDYLSGRPVVGATLSNSFATGAVTGTAEVGGLAGYVEGTVSQSYATGNVTGASDLGGLVGETGSYSFTTNGRHHHTYTYGAVISTSYATGRVTGMSGSTNIGGLIGYVSYAADNSRYTSNSIVSDSFAIGAVTGGSNIGGLIGVNAGAALYGAFWDVQTSGLGSSAGGVGLTTAQLQGALPGGFATNVWGTGPGLFPYLLWQFPTGTPQVISGTAYSDGGVTLLNGGPVTVIAAGVGQGTVYTEANGYFYDLLAPGTLSSSGTDVAAFTTGAGAGAVIASISGTTSGLSIWGDTLIGPTAATTWSAASATPLQTQDAALIAGATGSNSTAQGVIGGLSNYGYVATGSGFTIDAPVSQSHGLFVQTTAGGAGITIASPVTLAGGMLFLRSTGAIAIDADVSAQTAQLMSGGALTVNDPLSVDGALLLDAGGAVAIDAAVQSPAVTLISGAGISETGSITAGTLTGRATGAVSLDGANAISMLGTFATNNAGFSLDDVEALTVLGAVSAGSGDVALTTVGSGSNLVLDAGITGADVSLVSGGTIGQSAAGLIAAAGLTGRAAGAVTLDSANQVANLDAFSTGNAGFSFVDSAALKVQGILDAGTGNVTLQTTGRRHNIALTGMIDGGTLDVIATGRISESGPGRITATTLTGSSNGPASFTRNNHIVDLGAFSTAGNAFSLDDARSLTVTGAITAGSWSAAGISLLTKGAHLNIDAALMAGNIDLVSAGAISQNAAGIITAGTLTGNAGQTVTLSDSNRISNLGPFTSAGDFTLNDGTNNLAVLGGVNAGSGTLSLTTADLVINAALTAGTVDLVSTGAIYMPSNSAGSITAGTLTGSASSLGLSQYGIAIANLGPFSVSDGYFNLPGDSVALTVTGPVSAPYGIKLTTSGNILAIDAPLTTDSFGSVNLISAGIISQSSAGVITTGILTGTSQGDAKFWATNAIADLGAFNTNYGGFLLTDDEALTVTGVVNTGNGTLTLNTLGSGNNITIQGTLATGTLDINTSGNTTQTDQSAILANKINVVAQTGIFLVSAFNNIRHIGTHTTVSGPNKIYP